MGAAKLGQTLDAARTDACWVQDFTFWTSETDPEIWPAGTQATLALVPKSGVLRGEASFLLTSQSGALVMLPNGCGVRLSAEAMGERTPGTYDFELRRHDANGDIVAVLVGGLVIEQGLSEFAAGDVPPGPVVLTGARGGTVRVVAGANLVRTVLSGVGPNSADLVTFNDALTNLGAATLQEAVVALWEQAVAPQDDFSQSFNSGLGSYLGVL